MSISIEQIEHNGDLDAPGVQRELRKLARVFPLAGNLLHNKAVGTAQLEDAVTQRLSPTTTVSALPGSPYDGQTIFFQSASMATDGVAWELRYRSAGGTYKWEFVGGASFRAINTTATTGISSATYSATNSPSLTVPLAGEYRVEIEGAAQNAISNPNAEELNLSLGVGGVNTGLLAKFGIPATAQWARIDPLRQLQLLTLASGGVLTIRHATTNGGGSWSIARKAVSILPVRVG